MLDRGRERSSAISHLLLHGPAEGHSVLGKAEARIFMPISHLSARGPNARPPSAVFPTPLVDNWVGSLWGTNWCPYRMPFSRYAQFTHSWKAESGHPSPGPAHLLTEMKNKRCRLPPLGSFPSHSPSRTSWFTCELQQGSTTMGIRTCCSPTAYHSLPRCFPFKNAFTACPNGKCCAHRMNERKRSKLPFTCPESHS